MDIQKLSYNSKEYPYLLRQISDPPRDLFCIGDISLLKKRCIAVVGTREPTKYGLNVVRQIITPDVNNYDCCIVSGLAKGIDASVHKRCLEIGVPTIAVVAGSLKDGWPMQNKELFAEISEKGLIVAEYPLGTRLQKYMFAKRNRIMVGLSEACIVVESKEKGGSLVTAQLGLDFDRDVYVIPGDINRKTSQGCNKLIKDGAGVILNKYDFLNILENEQRRFYI